MVSGLSAAELEAGGDGATPSAALRPVLRGIGLFVAGFTLVFVALGATASSIGRLLECTRLTLAQLSGALIILLGVVMLLGALPARVWAHAGAGTLGVVSRVTGERRFDVRPSRLGGWAAPAHGHGLRLRLDAVHRAGARRRARARRHNGTLAGGVLLLFAYSLGLALPFVLVGLAFGRFTAALARARHWLWAVELVAGVVLIVFGVLLLTDNVGWVSTHSSRASSTTSASAASPRVSQGRSRARCGRRRVERVGVGLRPARPEHVGERAGEGVHIARPAGRDVGAVAHDPGRPRSRPTCRGRARSSCAASRARPSPRRRSRRDRPTPASPPAAPTCSPSAGPAPPRRSGSSWSPRTGSSGRCPRPCVPAPT